MNNRTLVSEIEGVFITPLKIFSDERGSVMKMMGDYTLINDMPEFNNVSEIYFSVVKKDAVKAWHGHKYMTLNYACIYGRILVGLCDMREGKTFEKTCEVYLDDSEHYKLLTIPPGVWNGFRVWPDSNYEFAIMANAASHVHSPDEIERIKPEDFPIPFSWGHYEIAG